MPAPTNGVREPCGDRIGAGVGAGVGANTGASLGANTGASLGANTGADLCKAIRHSHCKRATITSSMRNKWHCKR